MQKTKTFHALIFHKTWKYRVGLILATICHMTPYLHAGLKKPNSISEKKKQRPTRQTGKPTESNS